MPSMPQSTLLDGTSVRQTLTEYGDNNTLRKSYDRKYNEDTTPQKSFK